MKLHLDQTEGIHLINGYDDDGIVVDQNRHTSSLILSPTQITTTWSLASAMDLTEDHCASIAGHQAEIVLMGTGRRHINVDPRWMFWFGRRGMGLEVMTTRAACRTYNILAGEGRPVVAALILD